MSQAEGGEVELLPAPDKVGMLIVCTADNCRSPAGGALANYAESGVSS
jgi:folate-dependent tRNA-U54 methylase TrmFO/GidA